MVWKSMDPKLLIGPALSFIFAALRYTLPSVPHPIAWAGFGLGVGVLTVALVGLATPLDWPWTVGAAAGGLFLGATLSLAWGSRRQSNSSATPDMEFRDAANQIVKITGAPRIYANRALTDQSAYGKLDIWARRMRGDSPERLAGDFWLTHRLKGVSDYSSDIPDQGLVFIESMKSQNFWEATHYDPMVVRAQFDDALPAIKIGLKQWTVEQAMSKRENG